MKWYHIYCELIAGLVLFLQIFSIWMYIHTGRYFFCITACIWTTIIFGLVWYAFIKRFEGLK